MVRPKRRILFVDPKVQVAFLLRIAAYWFLCTVASGIVLFIWMMFQLRTFSIEEALGNLWEMFAPAMLISAFMLPVLLFDCLRLTNRMCGAIYRMRREMRNLALGDATHAIAFRQGDFWPEFADEFNAVRLRIIQLEERLQSILPETAEAESAAACNIKPAAEPQTEADDSIVEELTATVVDARCFLELQANLEREAISAVQLQAAGGRDAQQVGASGNLDARI